MIPIYHADDRSRLFSRLGKRTCVSPGIRDQVREIVAGVKQGGDAAVLRCAEEVDGIRRAVDQMIVDPQRMKEASARADPEVLRELEKAIFNIHAYHKRQLQQSWEYTRRGVVLGQRVWPLDRVGVYVPGGPCCSASTILMSVIPAKVAGVPRIVVVTPPGGFYESPIFAAALVELNVQEIYLIDGAPAIAALAYGTETIPKVDKIVGGGGGYVAAAKREVFGDVAIDLIAGPGEVVVLATAESNPRFVAADMLSQAEHDESACAVCFTDSDAHAVMLKRELELQLESLPRQKIASNSLQNFGAVVVLESSLQAVEWINEIAPEQIEVFSSVSPMAVDRITHAGSVFYGDHSPEAVGDYFAGSNHVRPTHGAARFFSPLGVYDFQRRTSTIRYSREALRDSGASIEILARAEGMEGHARSVEIRRGEEPIESDAVDDNGTMDT